MAIASTAWQQHTEKLRWYLANRPHSVWDHFGTDMQQALVEEDRAALKRVSLVLVSLITAGMLMSMVTLLVVLATS